MNIPGKKLEQSKLKNYYTYFEIKLNLNKTKFIGMSQNTFKNISNKISKTFVGIHAEDFTFNSINNVTSNTLKFSPINFIPINLAKKVSVDVQFKFNNVTRDSEYIASSDFDTKTFYSISSINKDTLVITEQNNKLSQIDLEFLTNNEEYISTDIRIGKDELNGYHIFRTEKFDSLMARTGGLFQSLVFILNFISYFIIDYQYYAKVLTNTLDIDFYSCEVGRKLEVKNVFNPEILKKNFEKFRHIRYRNEEPSYVNANNNNSKFEKEEPDIIDLNKSSKRKINSNHISNFSNIILEEKENINKNKRGYEMNSLNINSIIDFENKKKLEENSEAFKKNLEFEKANYDNKMTHYVVNSQKKIDRREKIMIKKIIKDDVFFRSKSFHILDLLYSCIKKIPKFKFETENNFKIDNKFKLFEKSKEIFQLNFDVNNMIKKNIEINLIIYLLMNNDQIKMYSLVKKPIISLNNHDLNDFDLIYDELSRQKLYTAKELKKMEDVQKSIYQKSYENILEKQSTPINKKLLKLVNERLFIMFENFDNDKNN
jgi:hypothetical protein